MLKEKLIELRKRKQLTQKQMAQLLNVVESCYAHYEQGRNEPSVDMIRKMSVIFDVTTDELLEVETDEQRKKIWEIRNKL